MAFQYYFDAFRNYATFTGRARRSEYWYFVLFHTIAAFTLILTDLTVFENEFPFLTVIYILGSVVPSLALIVRRLHDVGKSGWFYFVGLIPVIGGIWLLVLYCTDGEVGPNQYGPNPKGIGNDTEEDETQINQIGL